MQAGFEPGISRSRGVHLKQKASEEVWFEENFNGRDPTVAKVPVAFVALLLVVMMVRMSRS